MKMLTNEELKIAAKRLKKDYGIRSCEAHERIARSLGFKTYNSYLNRKVENEKIQNE